MKGMLALDPEERLTALDCVADSYFDTIRDSEVEKLINNTKIASV